MSSKSLHFIKRVIKVIAPYQNTINPTKRECRDSTSTKIKTPHLFSEVLPSIRLNYGQQEFFSIPNFVWKKLPAAWNTDPPAGLSFWSTSQIVLLDQFKVWVILVCPGKRISITTTRQIWVYCRKINFQRSSQENIHILHHDFQYILNCRIYHIATKSK